MGVAVEIEVTRSRAADRCAALGALLAASGLGLAVLHLLSGPTLLVDAPAEPRAAIAAVLGAFAAWAVGLALRDLGRARAGGPGAPGGRVLRVGDDGEAVLGGPAPAPERPMSLRRACTLPGLTLLIVAPYPQQSASGRLARPTVLLLGRDAVPADSWRRLHVWLRWIERGRTGP